VPDDVALYPESIAPSTLQPGVDSGLWLVFGSNRIEHLYTSKEHVADEPKAIGISLFTVQIPPSDL